MVPIDEHVNDPLPETLKNGGIDAVSVARGAVRLLGEVRDVLDERIDEGPPSWCERRGWTGFLLGLGDEELMRLEREGLGAGAAGVAGLPASLAALAGAVREATRLPSLGAAASLVPSDAGRAVRARKLPQLAGLLGAVDSMARDAARIVDVGSGSGHLTRIAAEILGRHAVGLERSAARVERATARAGERSKQIEASGGKAVFQTVDAGRDALSFEQRDLVIGLHACGALGDRLVVAAAEVGCDVALVSCCFQKIEAPSRAALSRAAAGLTLRREVLGLANLTSRALGVETTIEATMAAREARYALIGLLRARGLEVAPGEEMRGINRRRAHHGLAEIAARALSLRGQSPPSAAEVSAHEEGARRRFAVVRRLSLPRNMLARLVELTVVLDRAAALAESGLHVCVAEAFTSDVSPRNVGLFASRDPARLPAIAG